MMNHLFLIVISLTISILSFIEATTTTQSSVTTTAALTSSTNAPATTVPTPIPATTTTEKDLLAIAETLKEFKNILLGKIRVYTDHKI